jgi:hypothetical protein
VRGTGTHLTDSVIATFSAFAPYACPTHRRTCHSNHMDTDHSRFLHRSRSRPTCVSRNSHHHLACSVRCLSSNCPHIECICASYHSTRLVNSLWRTSPRGRGAVERGGLGGRHHKCGRRTGTKRALSLHDLREPTLVGWTGLDRSTRTKRATVVVYIEPTARCTTGCFHATARNNNLGR